MCQRRCGCRCFGFALTAALIWKSVHSAGKLLFADNALKEIPPADVRPVVRGKWIDYDDDYGAYCCSVCEQNAPEDTEWPYCPHCGAYMYEGE